MPVAGGTQCILLLLVHTVKLAGFAVLWSETAPRTAEKGFAARGSELLSNAYDLT